MNVDHREKLRRLLIPEIPERVATDPPRRDADYDADVRADVAKAARVVEAYGFLRKALEKEIAEARRMQDEGARRLQAALAIERQIVSGNFMN